MNLIIEEKIGNNINLEELSQLLCEKYQLGKYQSYHLMDTGIEDFNYCLSVDNKKYLVKIFNKERNEEEVTDYIKKYHILQENEITCPKILKVQKENTLLIIMEYIEGQDLYSLNESITKNQVDNLIEMMKKVHQIPSTIKCIYDDYHIHHFHKTYDRCFPYLEEEWKKIGESLKKEYDKIDFAKMPRSFIHGDLHKGNIMKDKQGDLYLIDFASCGYSYRIIDIVEFINNTLFDYRELKLSKQRMDYFLTQYELTDYEKKNLKVLMKCYAFISIALKQYDFCHAKNQRDENEYWIKNNKVIIKNLTDM